MVSESSNNSISFARRMRLILWSGHQPFIAAFLALCVIGMSSYFWIQSRNQQGLIDIDQASPVLVEYKIDINQAEWPQIVILPGVGQKLAQAIVAYRQQHGPFVELKSIQDVPGIGNSKFEQLKPYLMPISRSR